jgi:hypothetical protein
MAHRLTILDPEGRPIGAVGHDLHGRALGADDLHAHELIAL